MTLSHRETAEKLILGPNFLVSPAEVMRYWRACALEGIGVQADDGLAEATCYNELLAIEAEYSTRPLLNPWADSMNSF